MDMHTLSRAPYGDDTPPNYLCVFRADPDVVDDVADLGRDPDFGPPLPTWGICRPSTRRSVKVGSYVVFLGYYPNDRRYLVKGWLRVGDKIGYLNALERFPDRPNVIIRDDTAVGDRAPTMRGWKREDLREEVKGRYRTVEPDFLTRIHQGTRTLVQLPGDPHEIDNWKCQRMFLCRKAQLARCIDYGQCKREKEFPALDGYIVAAPGEWRDVGPLRTDWHMVVPDSLRARLEARPLRTRYGQHNARTLSLAEVEAIIEALA